MQVTTESNVVTWIYVLNVLLMRPCKLLIDITHTHHLILDLKYNRTLDLVAVLFLHKENYVHDIAKCTFSGVIDTHFSHSSIPGTSFSTEFWNDPLKPPQAYRLPPYATSPSADHHTFIDRQGSHLFSSIS